MTRYIDDWGGLIWKPFNAAHYFICNNSSSTIKTCSKVTDNYLSYKIKRGNICLWNVAEYLKEVLKSTNRLPVCDASCVLQKETVWSHLPTDNTISSPSFLSFTLLPSSLSSPVFGTAACVWWVSTNTSPSRGLFCWSVDVFREGRMRVCGGFRGSFRESRGGIRTGGHFLWAQRVQR